ncbi:MAG: DUF11 domain-containing protein [Clostridia bacterium]|nr:DUF11 domain-containing protein [Clostridia bacterium]
MTISNKVNITYDAATSDGETARANRESNTVNTEILTYSVQKAIRCDKTSVREGDSVHNTATVANNSATKLFDNFFSIPQPDGATFVEGSVKINGISQPSYDPVAGFSIPDLNSGETVVIEYDLKANAPITAAPITHFAKLNYTVSDPTRGNATYSENTDTLSINIIADKIDVVKSVDKAFAVKGEKLHYTITIVNTGNVTKNGMVFKDPIPDGTTFVPYSVKINGMGYSVYDPAIGFVLQSIAPGQSLTVEFDVTVN